MKKLVVGFTGLGLMGNPMAHRLLEAGYHLHIYNRSISKAEELIALGAEYEGSPAMVAEHADVVFSMVTDSAALEAIATGQEGILNGLKQGGIHVDCSTVLASTTGKLYDLYREADKSFIHSPVLGSTTQASEGQLLTFPGGDCEKIEIVKPLLSTFSRLIQEFDHPTQSTNFKIALNSIITGTIGMLSQAMVFLEKAGVNNSVFLSVLAESTLNSATIQFKGNNILDRNFNPRFTVENLLKDARYMSESCAAIGCRSDVSDALAGVIKDAVSLGHGKEDYSAMIKAFESAANVEVKRRI